MSALTTYEHASGGVTTVTEVKLSRTNVPSSAATALVLSELGLPVRTCERWLQVQFTDIQAQPTNLHIWLSPFNLVDGWTVYAGSTDTYTEPTKQRSTFALTALTGSSDTGVNIGLLAPDSQGRTLSYYIVLQGLYVGPPNVPLQGTALNLQFGWVES